jgi:hypothetical protein
MRRRLGRKLVRQPIASVVSVLVQDPLEVHFSELGQNFWREAVDARNGRKQIFQMIRRDEVSLVNLGPML